MRAKLVLPLTVSFAAALLAQAEGTAVARWAADHGSACVGPSPAAACTLNGTVSVVAGAFFAVETLAGVLVGLVLFRNGKRLGAGIAIAALLCGLAVEHVWLLT